MITDAEIQAATAGTDECFEVVVDYRKDALDARVIRHPVSRTPGGHQYVLGNHDTPYYWHRSVAVDCLIARLLDLEHACIAVRSSL